MQREVVELGIDIPGAVIGIPSVEVCPQLCLKCWHRGEQIGTEGLLGEGLLAVHPPDLVVLVVIQKPVPLLTHE